MGKPTGFMEFPRENVPHRPVAERVDDFNEVETLLPEDQLRKQAARCMDCGIPFCHGSGCPLHNRIPEFNELVYQGRWQEACDLLHTTNNFPEITGRVCPALCEASCTLNIDGAPVLIRHIELQIVERGWREGWIQPRLPAEKSGKRVAVIGSGPAGLACAQQLARVGHKVIVFDKSREAGGLLRYGIPDFKLDKSIIARRVAQMRAEGVEFQMGVDVGDDISLKYLKSRFDAVCLTLGAGQPRDLDVSGRDLQGIHFALTYLMQQNRINASEKISDSERIDARGKRVVVIGGGDTGSDCIGTARRQGAAEVVQLEILPRPPENTNPETPWPEWPRILRTSTSHEEGCERRWSVLTKCFTGENGHVTGLDACEVDWEVFDGRPRMQEKPGSEFSMLADLVLLAMGFVHVVHSGLVEKFGLAVDERGNLKIGPNGETSVPGVFAAGDAVSGASLIVRAILAGRKVAESIDTSLRAGKSL